MQINTWLPSLIKSYYGEKKKSAKPNGELSDVIFCCGRSTFSHHELVTVNWFMGHTLRSSGLSNGDLLYVMNLSRVKYCAWRLTDTVLGHPHSPVRFVLILFSKGGYLRLVMLTQ